MHVSASLRSAAIGGSSATEESIEDFPEAAKVYTFETTSIERLVAAMPETVVGSTFIRVGEHLVGFVNFLEFICGSILMVVVGVVSKGQLTEGLFYILIGTISTQA